MDLVFVGDRCGDHSPSSGYDQICTLFPDAGWLSGRALAAGRLTWHRPPSRPAAGPRQVFHVFYGDCSGSALPAVLRERFPQATIISTVHQPISRLAGDPAGRQSLHLVDAIITVSRIQARQLTDRARTDPLLTDPPPASIHALPHGVWTRRFRPEPGPDRTVRDGVLVVGSYLRDWPATARLVETLARAGVRSVVLGSEAARRLSVADALVEIRPRVSETELVRMYHRAAALLLPVLDATASNALLEAMAAGCPVVCPRFPSLVDEYLADRCDSFEPGNHDVALARLVDYVRRPGLRAARSRELIRRAGEFDWSRLRPHYELTYQQVAAATGPG